MIPPNGCWPAVRSGTAAQTLWLPALAASSANLLVAGVGDNDLTAAYAAIKQAIHFGAAHDLADSLENEAVQQDVAGATADHAAAVEAFLARRPPEFHGR